MIDQNTKFEDGSIHNLKVGQQVEVTSYQNDKNILKAKIIEFDGVDDGNNDREYIEFECNGTIVDKQDSSFRIDNCKNDFGKLISTKLIQFNSSTIYKGLTEELLQNGIPVEVEGIIINDNNIAKIIEIDNN
ncbi:DUF5666 domain-containing protein [Vibrio cholerae]|uniref:DUF5666 domain-containing protein n=1 Tax=Vibrio cholerae TaxID=666 RepID=UPI003B528EF0